MNKATSLSAIALWLGIVCCTSDTDHAAKDKKKEEQKAAAQTIQNDVIQLPKITLIEETGRQFSAETLEGKTILIFFSSDCDHCQREATNIEKHLPAFASYSLYFVSMNTFPMMRKFAQDYKIDDKPNIQFLRADGKTVFDAMGAMQTPTICVFNGEKKLVKRFDGETNIEDILKVL